MKNLILAINICLLLAVPCQARTIYVDANTPDNNDGSTWAKAYEYLRDALADANSTSDINEIRVAQGIYIPDNNSDDPNGSGNKEATFHIINSVALKGGFAGFGRPDPNARDIEIYTTVLSGDLNGDDGPDFTNNEENSYHVVTGSDTNETAVLDGFTITGGNAHAVAPYNDGGGMYNHTGSPTVSNCTFSGNTASYGGGMFNGESSNPTLTNCIFSGNSASYGAGIWIGNSSPTVTNCIFIGNSADERGGGMDNWWYSTPTVTNCTFSENSAGFSGGGIYNYRSNPALTSCTFSGNSSHWGGGMCYYGDGGALMATGCTFSGNSAHHGGGIYNGQNCILTVTNSTFSGNAAFSGSACACDSFNKNYPSDIQLTNCILWDGGQEIWNNDVSIIAISYTDLQGGQAACYDPCHAIEWSLGNIDVDPCFVEAGQWVDANDPNIIVEPNDPNAFWINGDYHLKSQAGRWDPKINNGDFTGDRFVNLIDFAYFANLWHFEGENLIADLNRDGWVDMKDLAIFTERFLTSVGTGGWVFDAVTSRCIDIGNPGSPLADELLSIPADPNNILGQNLRINMGAFGGTAEASMSPYGWSLLSDITNNGISDFNDLDVFSSLWLNTGEQLYADFDRDGDVDFIDFALLAQDWLEQTTWHE